MFLPPAGPMRFSFIRCLYYQCIIDLVNDLQHVRPAPVSLPERHPRTPRPSGQAPGSIRALVVHDVSDQGVLSDINISSLFGPTDNYRSNRSEMWYKSTHTKVIHLARSGPQRDWDNRNKSQGNQNNECKGNATSKSDISLATKFEVNNIHDIHPPVTGPEQRTRVVLPRSVGLRTTSNCPAESWIGVSHSVSLTSAFNLHNFHTRP